MRRGLSLAIRWIMTTAILASLIAGGYVAQVLVREGSVIGETYHQGSWGAVQTDSEALKLSLAIERYRRTRTPADLQLLDLQRELYLSRILFLRDSSETAQVRTIPELHDLLDGLFETATTIDGGVDRIDHGDLAGADDLEALVAANRLRTRQMTQFLLLQDSTLLNRARLVGLFEQISTSVVVILLASSVLVMLALRQASAARSSEIEAQDARAEVSSARQRLESALDGAADPFIVSDREGLVVFANRAYRTLFQQNSLNAAPGAPLSGLLRAEAEAVELDRSARPQDAAADFLDRAVTPGESFLAHLKDGRTFLYRAQRTAEGGLVLTRTDLSERVRLERERAEFRDQFHHAMKMEALGRLAGGIAHDFNNMLTAILSFGEMLNQDLADRPQQQRMAGKIVAAGHRASALVRQVLSFSRKDQPDLTEVDLGEIATETLALLRATTPTSIETSVQGMPGALVSADPGQISQVIMNLCVNARDAIGNRRGAIAVAVEHPAFDRGLEHDKGPTAAVTQGASGEIESDPDGRSHVVHVGAIAPDKPCVRLSIRDTGGGIPRSVLERMFEPFYTTKGVGKGSGLGLAAVHGIVLSLSGTISVESVEGAGTTFRIYLPMAQPPKAADADPEQARPEQAA